MEPTTVSAPPGGADYPTIHTVTGNSFPPTVYLWSCCCLRGAFYHGNGSISILPSLRLPVQSKRECLDNDHWRPQWLNADCLDMAAVAAC